MTITPAAEWAERARWARWHQQERTDAAHHVGMARATDSGDVYAADRRLALYRATMDMADAWGQYAVQAEECFRDAAMHEMTAPATCICCGEAVAQEPDVLLCDRCDAHDRVMVPCPDAAMHEMSEPVTP